MTIALLRFRCSLSCVVSLGFALSIAMPTAFLTGCGGSGSHGTTFSGNTAVTVLTTSTANAQFSQFNATMETLTLTSQSGQTVSLLTKPLYPEFIHVNGTAEPLATVSVPQGVYTAATATFGGTSFTCLTLTPKGGIETSNFAYGYVPADHVTFSLPAPITILGTNMGLSLDLQVSKSAHDTSCYVTGIEPFSITPTFTVSPIVVSSEPTNPSNGRLNGLAGVVASVDTGGNNFVVTSADGSNYGGGNPGNFPDPANGPSWQVASNGSTKYQRIADASKLTVGMPVDMDATIQQDGSLLATRVAVYDTNTTDLTLWTGPLLYVNKFEPVLYAFGQDEVGPLLVSGAAGFDFSEARFGTSGQLTNVADLPFHATFTSANMVAGQNVATTYHAPNFPYSPNYVFPATITLLPQTINGTVNSVSTANGFRMYSVSLASYDLFPTLAVQGGQATLLKDPGTVIVYADSSAQMLSAAEPGSGSIVRFNGLVFNDNGTLRMDCVQIEDGVADSVVTLPAKASAGASHLPPQLQVQRDFPRR
jgi:hypothetical protein